MADLIKFEGKEKEVPSYYCNVTGLTMGPYDFIFSFGFKTPDQARSDDKEARNVLANVSMSPTQAKTMAVLLQEMLQVYEKDFGEIPMEKKFKTRYEKIFGKQKDV